MKKVYVTCNGMYYAGKSPETGNPVWTRGIYAAKEYAKTPYKLVQRLFAEHGYSCTFHIVY